MKSRKRRDPTHSKIQQNKGQENFGENEKKMRGAKVLKVTFLIKGVDVESIAMEAMAVDAAKVCKRFYRVM